MYLWEVINHPEGYTMTNEEFNARWNMLQEQGDQQANYIRDILLMLYETLLNDTDGTAHIKADLPEYAATNLKAILKIIDTRLNTGATNLTNHKTSNDHDYRYYTETEVDTKVSTLNSGISLNSSNLSTHKVSTDHDYRYYTKEDLIPWLRAGDTYIREEVFTIVSSNLGDGTFTYMLGENLITGALNETGGQVFNLTQGVYDEGQNRLEVIINDTLRRSVASGGIEEISPTSFMLTSPEGDGAEVTAKYYERLGVAAEYNIKLSEAKPPQNNGKTMWFKVIG